MQVSLSTFSRSHSLREDPLRKLLAECRTASLGIEADQLDVDLGL
jgi:hypothetical protein